MLDEGVGRIVETLKKTGQWENTLIIFSSDNGPHQEGRHDAEFFDSNGPLRGIKRDLYEGGVRVPMIASWPWAIKAGSTSDHLSSFEDVFPTLAELGEGETPSDLTGLSFAGSLLGTTQAKREFVYWEFEEQGGKQGIVTERWKGIRLDTLDPDKTRFALYDLSTDLAESNDVSLQYPTIAEELLTKMLLAGGSSGDAPVTK